MSKPKVGERYRVTTHYGNDMTDPEYLPDPAHRQAAPGWLTPGMEAEVVEVVPADVPGAGDDQEPTYVVAFSEPIAVIEDGEAVLKVNERRWGARAEDFGGLLEKVT